MATDSLSFLNNWINQKYGGPASMQWGVTDPSTGQWNQYAAPDNGIADSSFNPSSVPGASQQMVGMTPDKLMWNSPQAADQLKQIGQRAGLPANFDWTPYIQQATVNKIQQSGRSWDTSYDNWSQPILDAVTLAAKDNPSLQPVVSQIGPGSQFWQQGESQRDAAATNQKRSAQMDKVGAITPFLGAAGAGMFGPANAGLPNLASGATAAGEGALPGLGAASAGAASAAPSLASTVSTPATTATTNPGSFQVAAAPTGTMTDVGGGLLNGSAAPATTATGLGDAGMEAAMLGGPAATTAMSSGAGALGAGTIAGGIPPATGGGATDPITQILQKAGLISGGGIGGGGNGPQGDYQVPWGSLFNSLFGAGAASMAAGNAKDMMNTIINSDQFRPQQSQYFQPLYDAATKGIGGTAYGDSIVRSVGAKDSSLGYNLSGNMAQDLARGLNTGTTDYIKALTPLAMGNKVADTSSLANTVLNQQNAGVSAISGGLTDLFKGQQPTLGQQVANNTPTNKSLVQQIFG